MANPFLVLGGVAVGVITAGIGVLQVPGWIDSANDSAVTNDLSQVALSEEAAITVVGSYIELPELKTGVSNGAETGVKFQQWSGTKIAVDAYDNGDKWVSAGISKSGYVFLRDSSSTTTYKSTAKLGSTDAPTIADIVFATGAPDVTLTLTGTGDAAVLTVAAN